MRKQSALIWCLVFTGVYLINCTKKDTINTPPVIPLKNIALQALPATALAPSNNLPGSQKIALGKLLFWDPIISGNKDVACGTCHHASLGYTDNLDLAIGSNGIGLGVSRYFASPNNIPFTKRNTPTIVNTAFNGMDVMGAYDPATAPMFYDERVISLELQCLEPMKTFEEMAGHEFLTTTALDSIINRLQAIPEYVQLFTDAFGANSVTIDNMGKAIASFERTLISNNSPFDRYMRGDAVALSSTQIQGMNAFQTDGCIKCHSGAMFSDYQLHILSVPDNPKRPTDGGVNSTYAFRTTSLRNLALTAPYMHSGMFSTLDQVLDFYDQVGNRHSQNTNVNDSKLDTALKPVNSNDKQLIIQFLKALNDSSFDKTIPAKVPSNLHVGGNI